MISYSKKVSQYSSGTCPLWGIYSYYIPHKELFCVSKREVSLFSLRVIFSFFSFYDLLINNEYEPAKCWPRVIASQSHILLWNICKLGVNAKQLTPSLKTSEKEWKRKRYMLLPYTSFPFILKRNAWKIVWMWNYSDHFSYISMRYWRMGSVYHSYTLLTLQYSLIFTINERNFVCVISYADKVSSMQRGN